MAKRVLVDAGFLVALLSRRDQYPDWAFAQVQRWPPPWSTCEAALSEAVHLLDAPGEPGLSALLRRQAVVVAFELAGNLKPILAILHKYASVPASLADACLVRMTETLATPFC
jgi:hypothetical protein